MLVYLGRKDISSIIDSVDLSDPIGDLPIDTVEIVLDTTIEREINVKVPIIFPLDGDTALNLFFAGLNELFYERNS